MTPTAGQPGRPHHGASDAPAPHRPLSPPSRWLDWLLIAGLLGGGCALAHTLANSAGEAEAWDNPSYFFIVPPILAAAAGLAGLLRPRHTWRWAAALSVSQPLHLLLASGGALMAGDPQAPLFAVSGPVLTAALLVVTLPAAWLGGWLRRASTRLRTERRTSAPTNASPR